MHGKVDTTPQGDSWAMGQRYKAELDRFHAAAAKLTTHDQTPTVGFYAKNERAIEAIEEAASLLSAARN